MRQKEASGKHHKQVTKLTSYFHDVVELNLEEALEENFSDPLLIILDIAPDNYERISTLKDILGNKSLNKIPIFFILSSLRRIEIIQANNLGATDFITHPIDPKEFQKKLEAIANKTIEKSWENLNPTQTAALKVSLKVFEDTFDGIKSGNKLPDNEIRESCDLLIKATAEAGISDMMSAIRTHHNYTYRHSMMVSGYLAAFALLLGISGQDLQNVTVGGILHDIGKAHVPTELLNKPGPLTDEEWQEMKKHPAHSRKILENSNCHPDVVDGCIHHHEKLDGTGYPDGLKGDEISDIARMVSIADVFSGLTEKRSYKPSLSNQEAYDIMLGMEGHLDLDLVNAFKPIALQ